VRGFVVPGRVAVSVNADLASHHIEGLAHMGGGTTFSVPLVTKVGDFAGGELWHGGCIDGLLADFDAIVSLYPWERFTVNPATTVRIEFPPFDAAGAVPEADVKWLADRVVEFLEDGKRVLVHCQAGLNRSSLVVGKVLDRVGFGGDIVAFIRGRRCDAALCNPDFAAWVAAL
jgi:hypothetical protein